MDAKTVAQNIFDALGGNENIILIGSEVHNKSFFDYPRLSA